MAEFQWWLLLVGLVFGAGLVWLVLADSSRRDADVEAHEVPLEAAMIARRLRDEGREVDPDMAEAVLREHRRYLGLPPPDVRVPVRSLDAVDLAATFDAPWSDAPTPAGAAWPDPGGEADTTAAAADAEPPVGAPEPAGAAAADAWTAATSRWAEEDTPTSRADPATPEIEDHDEPPATGEPEPEPSVPADRPPGGGA